MLIQTLIVVALVAASFIYAAWHLLPQVARQALARGLLRWPLPKRGSAYLRKVTAAQAGCGCSGCDGASPQSVKPGNAASLAEQTIVFHPYKRR